MRSLAFALAVFAGASAPTAAHAQIQYDYQFRVAGLDVPGPLTLLQNQTLDLQVYLAERTGTTNLTTQGLIGAGVRITYNTPNTGIVAVTQAANIFHNPLFTDTPLREATTAFARLSENVDISPNPDPDPPVRPQTGEANRILIGTFRLTGQSPGTVTVNAIDYDPANPGNSSNVLANFTPIDNNIANDSINITVPVPEPASLLCGGVAAAGLLAGWRRRRGVAA